MPVFASEPIMAPEQRVLPEWIDYNGHMNVAYYSLAFDQSLDFVLEHSLGVGPTYVAERGMGPYVVQNHIHYLAELVEGEAFSARFLLVDADAKRLHCFLEMLRSRDGARVATSEQLLVNVDLGTRRSTPYPQDRLETVKALRAAHAELERPREIGAVLGIRRQPS